MNYTVKNIKTFIGMEGQGFNASLYRDNKKVAFVIDDASGGELNFEWVDYKDKAEVKGINFLGKEYSYTGTLEEKALAEYVATLPKRNFRDKEMHVSIDLFVEDLVNDYENKKNFKKLSKTKTLFKLDGVEYKNGEWNIYKKPFNIQIIKALQKTGKKIVSYINNKGEEIKL